MTLDLANMNTFIPSDFELVREQGETDRLKLSNAVIRLIDTPVGWQVNAEYRGELAACSLYSAITRRTAAGNTPSACAAPAKCRRSGWV